MKRIIGEVWKVKEGSKSVWKVQFPHGIMTYMSKRLAVMNADAITNRSAK